MMTKHFFSPRRPVLFAVALLLCSGATQAMENGENIFQNNCAVCHQPQAQGMAGLAPPLKSAQWGKYATARRYVPGVLLGGMNGSIALENGNFIGVMPPQNRLSDEEIAAVANYLFVTVNAQPGWKEFKADDIAAMRQNPPAMSALRALRKQVLAK